MHTILRKIIQEKSLLEDIMKKVLSLLAMTLMIVGLTGCMDDPDGSNQKVSGSTSSIQL